MSLIESKLKKQTSSLKTVLIVDDEEQVLSVTSQIIAKLGYTVSTARDGFEAISKYSEIHPDLVLMDINMPGIDGTETFFRLREINPKANIVLMSAFGLIPSVKDAFKYGLKDFAEKPLQLGSLKTFLDKYT